MTLLLSIQLTLTLRSVVIQKLVKAKITLHPLNLSTNLKQTYLVQSFQKKTAYFNRK